MFQKPDSSTGLRVLVIGHSLSASLIEKLLGCHGTSLYHCVDSTEAAEWLMGEGFRPDLVIAHGKTMDSQPGNGRLPCWAGCNVVTVSAALRDEEHLRIGKALHLAALLVNRRKPHAASAPARHDRRGSNQMQVAA
jgi:hypothetical protein